MKKYHLYRTMVLHPGDEFTGDYITVSNYACSWFLRIPCYIQTKEEYNEKYTRWERIHSLIPMCFRSYFAKDGTITDKDIFIDNI